ncbi:MAG: hypothetical protein D6735_15195, partial [Acidobacteria bacterium]
MVTPTPPIIFPHEAVTLSGVFMDENRSVAGRHVSFILRSSDGKHMGLCDVAITDPLGRFESRCDQWPGLNLSLTKLDAYEVLTDASYTLNEPRHHFIRRVEGINIVVAGNRPTQLDIQEVLLSYLQPTTVMITMVVGVTPYVSYPSIGTPVRLEARRGEDLRVTLGVVTTSVSGTARLMFTPTAAISGTWDLVAVVPTNFPVAQKKFYVARIGSCQRPPKILSHKSNFRLGEDAYYPPLVPDANAPLSLSLDIDWGDCAPGYLQVKVNSLPDFSKIYPVNNDGRFTLLISDVLDVFNLPPGRNLILIQAVSFHNQIFSDTNTVDDPEPYYLVHNAVQNLQTFVYNQIRRRLNRLSISPNLSDAILSIIATPISLIGVPIARLVRHPTSKRSVQAFALHYIFPHPSDKIASGLVTKMDKYILRRPNVQNRPAKVNLALNMTGKGMNVLELAVPIACDAGPFARAALLRFLDLPIFAGKNKIAFNQAIQQTRSKAGQRLLQRLSEEVKSGDEVVGHEIERSSGKPQLVFKFIFNATLPS